MPARGLRGSLLSPWTAPDLASLLEHLVPSALSLCEGRNPLVGERLFSEEAFDLLDELHRCEGYYARTPTSQWLRVIPERSPKRGSAAPSACGADRPLAFLDRPGTRFDPSRQHWLPPRKGACGAGRCAQEEGT